MGGARYGARNVEYWGDPQYVAIRSLRQLTDTTQGELAELCGITPGEVSCIERGIKAPRIVDVEAIADSFGLAPDCVMMEESAFDELLSDKSFREEIRGRIKKPGQIFYNGKAFPEWEVGL